MCVARRNIAHPTRILTHAQAEEKPGFTDGLLNILEVEQDNAVRLSSKDPSGSTESALEC